MFFGGGEGGFGGHRRQRGPRRTKNLVHQLSVTLEDLYKGTTRKLALQKNVICDACDGKYQVKQQHSTDSKSNASIPNLRLS